VKISAIIPAMNAASTLGETLDSVAAQSFAPFEVIVVDDGSSDATAAIAARHRIGARVISVPNRGAAAATNIGVNAAAGEWLAFLDSDDLWPPDRLESTIRVAEKSSKAAIIGGAKSFPDPAITPEELAGLRYVKETAIALFPGALFLRKDVFLALGGYDEQFRTGYFIDFYDRFRHAGHEIETIPECVLLRRIRRNSLGGRSSEAAAQGQDQLSRDFLRIAREAIRRKQKPKG
jgi:glycosyltransferase involved in cell wall biosynthesis